MYIREVAIHDIKSVYRFQMNFQEPAGWHVLIGDNGTGKTSVLRAIAAGLINVGEHKITFYQNQKLGANPLFNGWITKTENEGGITLRVKGDKRFDFGSGLRYNINDIYGDGYVSEIIFARKKEVYIPDTETSPILTNKEDELINRKDVLINKEDGWFSMSFGAKRDFSVEDKDSSDHFMNAHLSLLDETYRFSKITGWLKSLYKRNGKLEWIKSLLNHEDLLPNGVTFEGVKEVEESDELRVVFQKEGQELNFSELSDGYRSVLILILEILRQAKLFYKKDEIIFGNIQKGVFNIPISGVVLIDEIDAHLHPTWQARIGFWFTQYFPNIQFIVTTHSPLVCRACEKGSIWRLSTSRDERQPKEITGTDKDRLIYGNILDAYGTEIFGEDVSQSAHGEQMLKEMADLNVKSFKGKITEAEKQRLQQLQRILPTE